MNFIQYYYPLLYIIIFVIHYYYCYYCFYYCLCYILLLSIIIHGIVLSIVNLIFTKLRLSIKKTNSKLRQLLVRTIMEDELQHKHHEMKILKKEIKQVIYAFLLNIRNYSNYQK